MHVLTIIGFLVLLVLILSFLLYSKRKDDNIQSELHEKSAQLDRILKEANVPKRDKVKIIEELSDAKTKKKRLKVLIKHIEKMNELLNK